ncbi:hypothetical protein [Estrella lausannensis]|uniref:Uncharacterized protein n=1 Tax=Estrella lausannensis TaxID=483423 RepID=A0A0H5DS41_9BACT|nr:hypothetical protein [Estrella lausannensis]CRX39492.1 hypothetical protein ELAC_2172 [Estrella lausannensis]
MTTISTVGATPPIAQSAIPRPTLAYVESDHKPNILVKIITLIIEVVKAIFDFFQFWKSDPYQLEESQLNAFKKIQRESYLKPLNRPQKNDYASLRPLLLMTRSQIDQTLPVHEGVENPPIEEPPVSDYETKDFPIALQHMRGSMSSVVENVVDCFQERKILPLMERREEFVDKATQMIKDLSALVIQIGFQLRVPIFDLLRTTPLPQGENVIFQESSKKALNWLIENEDRDRHRLQIKESLEQACQELIEQEKLTLPNGNTLSFYTTPLINWIFNDERSPQFHTEHNRRHYPQTVIEPIYQQCLTILINKKFDALCVDLKGRVIDTLPELIENIMKANSQMLTEELGGRLADLLSHVKMSTLVDDLTFALFQHTKTYLKAKESIISETGSVYKHRTSRPDVEAEFIKACAKRFATYPEAHPKIVEIATIPQDKDPITWPVSREFMNWKGSIEEVFISDLCQQLVETLLPKKQIVEDDRIVEIDGLTNLWRKVIIPEEFKEVVSELEAFVQRFLPADFTLAADMKTLISNIVQQFILTTAKSQVRQLLSTKIYNLFKTLITPEHFSQMIESQLAPVIEEQCIDVISRHAASLSVRELKTELTHIRSTKSDLTALMIGIRLFILQKLRQAARSSENIEESIKKVTDLILEDLEEVFKGEAIETFNISKVKTALSGPGQGHRLHHDFAREAVLPNLDEIEAFIMQAFEKTKRLAAAEEQLGEKLFTLFSAKSSEFRRNGGVYPKETYLTRIAYPLIKEFEDVLASREFALDAPDEAVGKYLAGEGSTEENSTNIYSEIVLDLLFGVGEFGGMFTQQIVTSFKHQINQSLAKTLNRFKNDDYLLVELLFSKLQEKFSDKETMMELLFGEEEGNPPVDLSRSISRISGLVYDIFYNLAVPSTGFTGTFQSLIATPFLGMDSSAIDNTVRRIYNRLLQNETLNSNLVFRLKDIAARALATADLSIKRETALVSSGELTTV